LTRVRRGGTSSAGTDELIDRTRKKTSSNRKNRALNTSVIWFSLTYDRFSGVSFAQKSSSLADDSWLEIKCLLIAGFNYRLFKNEVRWST
jgi:hypothetical protein